MRTRFSARTEWPWGPPTLQYNGYRVFLGGRVGRGVGLTRHPNLVPKVLEKSRAIPLPTLRACVAYKKGENPPKWFNTENIFVFGIYERSLQVVLCNFVSFCWQRVTVSVNFAALQFVSVELKTSFCPQISFCHKLSLHATDFTLHRRLLILFRADLIFTPDSCVIMPLLLLVLRLLECYSAMDLISVQLPLALLYTHGTELSIDLNPFNSRSLFV